MFLDGMVETSDLMTFFWFSRIKLEEIEVEHQKDVLKMMEDYEGAS